MKVAIVGAGTRIGQPGFAFMEELRHQGMIEGDDYILDPKCIDFEGDTVVIPRGQPTSIPKSNRSKTGAAGIKRAAKQRRNRKR